MNNLNSILIEGNIVADVELKQTPNGIDVVNFTVASNRYFKKDGNTEQETSFFEVEAWGRLAESCAELGKNGRGLRVVGRLKQNRWVDGDGNNRSRTFIVAEHVEFKPAFKG